MNRPAVEVQGLSKRYGAALALDATTLAVEAGEFLTLLGPSGSGKTTLLMMIAGLTEPSAGRIAIAGRDVTGLPAYRRDIGVVFQNYALFPHLSVFENIAFPLRMRRAGEGAIEAAVRKSLELVRLPELAARRPRELSGGQQQRVAFARAIVFEPKIVLMDEPLGALDKKLRDELKLEIRRLHREIGATIVYVTHDQEEAMLLSDRICLMNHARVEQIDTPARLYARPATRFAADFIGDSNILEGTVAEVRGGAGVIAAGGVRLTTAHAAGLRAGAAVPVLVRPERIAIGGAGAENRLEARVESTLALGALHVHQVRLAGALLKVAALNTGGDVPRPGESVALGIRAEDVIPLAEAAR